MSLSDHRYTARIAPSSPTAIDAIHVGATIVDERGQRVTESFASGGLIWPTKPCPVLIDHDERFPVGFVSGVAERDGWHEAEFVLNMDKPLSDVARDLLRVGTPVSIGAKSLLKDKSLDDLGLATPVLRHSTAVLEEVSILSPGVGPAYRGAKVIRIAERGTALDRMRERQRERERAETKPKPPAEPAGEVIYGGGPLVRRNIGQVTAIGGRQVRTNQGDPIRYLNGDIIIDRADGTQEIFSGREGHAEAVRVGAITR